MTMISKRTLSESLHPENPLKAFEVLSIDERPFFAYRLPNERSIHLGVGHIINAEDYNENNDAFAISEFAPHSPIRIIIPDISFETPYVKPMCLPQINVADSDIPTRDYVDSINQLIKKLSHRTGKTVISRVISGTCNNISIASMFHELCRQYPDSYVYCWKTDDSVFWIGAIPELLLQSDGNKVASMALAGTMAVNNSAEWSKKNIEEQQLVTDFIITQFKAIGLTPIATAPKDKPAGPVKHLCTSISAHIDDKTFDCLQFARQLSPTPAVCGTPRETSLMEIAAIESHDRKYYGGFSGPIRGRKKCNLYVTLRCMSLDMESGKSKIYVGGGITSQSKVIDEWHETNLKAKTLLSVFNSKH